MVLITGASSGLGEEFAKQLASRGHDLALAARRVDRMEVTAAELRKEHGVEVLVFERDLGNEAGCRALLEDVEASGKDLVGLVNNAGFGSSGRFHEMDQDWELQQVRLNVETVHLLTGAVLPGMVERGEGSVLNVASIASFQPLPNMATYSATKAFVRVFSEAVNAELSGTGVSCTALCPGPMATEWEEVSNVGSGWMPGVAYVSTETAVRAAVKGMVRGARVVVPGRIPQALAWGGHLAPRSVVLPATRFFGDLRRK